VEYLSFLFNELFNKFFVSAAEAEELQRSKIVQDESNDQKKVSNFTLCVTL
jgi:hypothetical protein